MLVAPGTAALMPYAPLPFAAHPLQQEHGWCLCTRSSACALLEAVGSGAGDGGQLQGPQQASPCLPQDTAAEALL